MALQRYVVMGAGEVGFHLARALSAEGHDVTVIEIDPSKRERIEEELDVLVIAGNGAHPPVLTAAGAASCNLFMAVSSSDEANLAAACLAKRLGAQRTVVRVGEANEVITERRLLEEVFSVDLLLSTQLLTTTRILNQIRGHNTMAVEYLADGKVQLRKIRLDGDSPLTQKPLREVEMPKDSLVVAYFRGKQLTVPSGDDRAEPGDDALILGTTAVIGEAERLVSSSREVVGTVVIAGGGRTGRTVAQALSSFDAQIKIIERDRTCAEELATLFPRCQVIHGDATDFSLLQVERIDLADTFVALTGHDESNLMASLLARDLGVPQELALVHRAETSHLWRRLGLHHVFSPRALAYARIREYVESGYSANIVSLQRGAAVVIERQLASASPAAGVTLAEMAAPRGLIVGAVVRGRKVFVPRGSDRLEVGDLVILFVQEEELDTVRLLFPGRSA
ncbi:MAG: Trk system potassium transporter TrkA [Acidobacteria bacterium]|nr:Trk system potassium transporter TrkA [Acidobacteriota bacterium]